jgi:flagellar motor switch protein FliN/FliY
MDQSSKLETASAPAETESHDSEAVAVWAALSEVNQSISIELGRTEVSVSTFLQWTEGSLIELDRVSGQAVDILVNGKPFARGEVVTIAENFGVRIVEIITAD